MNVDMSNYLSAEYYMYYTPLWVEWVKILLVNVMHSIYYLCSQSRAVLLCNTHVCKEGQGGGGNFHLLLQYFWKSSVEFGCNLCPKSGAACAKSGQLLRQYADFCLLYLWPICNICSSHACSINISFRACEFGRQSTGRWLRECSPPPRCFVDSELFPLFIWTVFTPFQGPHCELWSWFLLCSWASLNVKINCNWQKLWETDKDCWIIIKYQALSWHKSK